MNRPILPTCPYCQTPLRLRSPGKISWEVPCPDCGRELTVGTHDGRLIVSRSRNESGESDSAGKTTRFHRPTMPAWVPKARHRLEEGLRDPLVLTWLAAGIAACILGVAFYRAGTRPATTDGDAGEVVGAGSAGDQPAEARGIPRPILAVIAPRPTFGAEDLPDSTGTKKESPENPVRASVEAKRPANPPGLNMETRAARGLSQKVLRFEQTAPVPFETIRRELAELVGVPIRYETGIETIERNVSLTIADATVGEILRELAAQVGLAYRIGPHGVVLAPSEAGGAGNRETTLELATD